MRYVTSAALTGLLAIATSAPAAAQIRFTPVFGYYHPAKDLGTINVPEGPGNAAGAFAVSRTSAPLVGLRAANSFGRSRFGWEASVLRTWNHFDWVPTSNTVDYQRNSVARHETPMSLRLFAQLSPPESRTRARVFAGPAMITAGTDWLRPDDAEWAVVSGAGAAFQIRRRLDLIAEVENYSYTTLSNRWQHDLAFSVGLQLRPQLIR